MDFTAIEEYMEWMDGELKRRARLLAGDKADFQPLTVATEEMPAIIDECGGVVQDTWRRWMRQGRKFGLYMIVVTQSTLVRPLGIKGDSDLLKNFDHVLLLGKAAVDVMPELAERPYPAVLRQGHRPPQPVMVPYDPRRDPDSPQLVGRNINEPAGMATEGGFVTQEEIDEMLRLERVGYGRREISRRLYNGIDSGAPYLRVKSVLDALVGSATRE